jgi:hypothetical protein
MSILQKFSIHTEPEPPKPITLTTTPEANPRKKYLIHEHEITKETKLPPLEPVITIADGNFAYKGDISFISGAPKAGKSNVIAAMLAACFLLDSKGLADTLNIRSTYAGTHPVIYIDTEQPKPYTQAMIQKVCAILGTDKQPPNLHIFNLREFSVEQRNWFLQDCFEQFNNEHIYIIDGITDFISSVNDDKESGFLINKLMGVSSEKQIPIILVIHENPGSQKSRGHIGSESDRKGGGSIGIRKDKDKGLHYIEAKFMRGSKDFENVYFRWNDEVNRFRLLDESELEETRAQDKMSAEERKRIKLAQLMNQAFGAFKELEKTRLKEFIMINKKCSDRTADRDIKLAFEQSILVLDNVSNMYSIKP